MAGAASHKPAQVARLAGMGNIEKTASAKPRAASCWQLSARRLHFVACQAYGLYARAARTEISGTRHQPGGKAIYAQPLLLRDGGQSLEINLPRLAHSAIVNCGAACLRIENCVDFSCAQTFRA